MKDWSGRELFRNNWETRQRTLDELFARSGIDNVTLATDANYVQPIGNMLNTTEAANFYLAKPFVDSLKARNDPRLPAIAIRYKGATSGPGQTVAIDP